ncbi:hypothetical protein BOX15_Mlig005479g1 [Macrostomum lignano]|uniref:Uncharacterized protein n=2 Tax=Macrostomum lignano TaxID=282301 RepID=A0A267EQI6_9PLAT|nr:hypothetical protein BOX15_Mlig005479g2 [Macrostomum lignano]PAA63099.1 hypothetical protein BOX15_Mlig005479g1 [Macrostomum lignano]
MTPFCSVILSALLACATGRIVRLSYVGCYIDYAGASRDLRGLSTITSIGDYSTTDSGVVSNTDMTHELCSGICSIGGYRYFGVGLSAYCFCDNSYGRNGASADSDCNRVCSGNSAQKCGGPYRNSIYAIEYPYNKTFTKIDRPAKTVVTANTTYWTVTARNDILCLAECEINVDCQAVIHNEQQCLLLRFAYPSTSLNSTTGDYYSRG